MRSTALPDRGRYNQPMTDSNTAPKDITNIGQRTALLKRMIRERDLLAVRIPGRQGSYTSAVLELDGDKKRLLLDELTPQEGHDQADVGLGLLVSTRHQGVDTRFFTKIREIGYEGSAYYYVVDLPERIVYHQRRQHHRVPIRMTLEHAVALGSGIQARLSDLSAGGLGGVIVGGGDKLHRGEEYQCRIELPGKPPLELTVELRFLGKPAGAKGQQRFGGQFKHVRPGQQRQIDRLVVELQREILRNE